MLYIIRGLQGSGKSTLARRLHVDNIVDVILEVDDFWAAGRHYHYEPHRVTESTQWLKGKIEKLLKLGAKIALPEVLETVEQVDFYREVAMLLNRNSFVISMHPPEVTNLDESYFHARNVHGVPAWRITEIKNRWEVYPGEIYEFINL